MRSRLFVAGILVVLLGFAVAVYAQQDYTITLTARQVKALQWEATRRNAQEPPDGVTWTAKKVVDQSVADLFLGIEQSYVASEDATVQQKLRDLPDAEKAKLKTAATWDAFVVWLAAQKVP